ncbi:MAG: TatD family hydrolase [Verrucomicrobiae bacterium]|nr:TatD family hydrolase [Verrucomicrobiae bacterium]
MDSPVSELIDTHAHLASQVFREPGELPALLDRAFEAGVTRIISIASDLEDSHRNTEIASEYGGVFATVGVHPTSVHEVTQQGWIDDLRGLSRLPKVVAIGEIGLDFFHPPQDGSPEEVWRALQDRFFRAQLDLAVELDLPVVIHQRNSTQAVAAVMDEYAGKVTAVFHCFSGTPEEARHLLDQGHYLSFTGIVTFPKALDVQEVAKLVPDDRIMAETDSPYLAPVPFRGKRCEPAYTRHTADFIASLRGISSGEFADLTTRNACRFFGLPGRPV